MKNCLFLVLIVFSNNFFAQNGTLRCEIYPFSTRDVSVSDLRFELLGKSTPFRVLSYKEIQLTAVAADTFSIHCTDYDCIDTTLNNIVIRPNEVTSIQFYLMDNCPYHRTRQNKQCPVCEKSDEVIPIVYGLLVHTDSSKKGKLKEDQDFIAGGCEVTCCDPNWYCKRDQKYF